LLASGAISVISLIGSSRHLEARDPDLAFSLFPFNVEALINKAERQFAGRASTAELDALVRQAKRLLAFSAGDARLYSLIGEAQRRSGESKPAFQAFERSLALSRTERLALQRVLLQDVENGKPADALERVDALFRRWPEQITAYAPLVSQTFAAPGSYDLLIGRMETAPPWRTTLISRLAANPATLQFSARLVQDLAAGASQPRPGEISNVLNGLINAGQYSLAYRTFLMTLSPKEQGVTGHVHDGRFQLVPSGRPFDWQIRNHPGVMFSSYATDAGKMDKGLTITFLQAPVRGLWVRQLLRLPAGRYSLSMRASAVEVALPKGLSWRIRCVRSNRRLVRLPATEGTYQDIDLSADLTVSPENCPLQVLELETRAIAESWNDRYRGSISFDDIRVVERSS
tara:strand:- start:801 stop:2003 length:1203 start_codon:yes stop_codon:yes gene_type:complete